jgi:hypothetical protein
MAGLVPAIHAPGSKSPEARLILLKVKDVDARDKPGHDEI